MIKKIGHEKTRTGTGTVQRRQTNSQVKFVEKRNKEAGTCGRLGEKSIGTRGTARTSNSFTSLKRTKRTRTCGRLG